MSNLLAGKKGIIFGALDQQSIAWESSRTLRSGRCTNRVDQRTGRHADGRNQ